MDVSTTTRHCDITPQLREHLEERLQKLTRFFERISQAHVVFTSEKHRQVVEITLQTPVGRLAGRAEAVDLRTALDTALDRVDRQLHRVKDKLRDYRVPRSRLARTASSAGFEESH